ncbi:UDP-4-amino-4C6-dideoxy-N-acetyl-beta-L-altrosamine transaminase [Rhodobacteraceae bacterium SB2]|nr:UDP-4-amino-4C6-dideoxy-N-acetyl-beta-L-altrosamine transaminase [Rhodobacteraceae bacterium SB2]
MIRYSEQHIDEDDIFEVKEALMSDCLTQGARLELFEESITKICKAKAAVAVTSASCALYLTYLAVGINEQTLVWTTANTFTSTASMAKILGAEIDFVDIEIDSYNICPEALRNKLTTSDQSPDFLVVVHFAGRSAKMKELALICQRYDITIIEDASHALGAQYGSSMIGACKYSIATIFSFHPVKTITTGEGGCITTKDRALGKKLKLLRNHNIQNNSKVPWYKTQEKIGINGRMTELQAALGISQLRKLKVFHEKRLRLVKIYADILNEDQYVLPQFDTPDNISSWHLFIIRIRERSEIKRNLLIQNLQEQGIGANLHYYPLYRLNLYTKNKSAFPNNELYFKTALTIPLNIKISFQDHDLISQKINALFRT